MCAPTAVPKHSQSLWCVPCGLDVVINGWSQTFIHDWCWSSVGEPGDPNCACSPANLASWFVFVIEWYEFTPTLAVSRLDTYSESICGVLIKVSHVVQKLFQDDIQYQLFRLQPRSKKSKHTLIVGPRCYMDWPQLYNINIVRSSQMIQSRFRLYIQPYATYCSIHARISYNAKHCNRLPSVHCCARNLCDTATGISRKLTIK